MTDIASSNADFSLRHASGQDAGLVLFYMRKLGAYQKMADEITATEAQIKRLLDDGLGEAVFGIYKGETVGFVYFCQKSSAFTGRSGLFIDGFLVDDDMRGKGLGKMLMGYLCNLALLRKCEMLEWGCLDWNAPTIEFYRKLGAYSLDGMTTYRFAPDSLAKNARLFRGKDPDVA